MVDFIRTAYRAKMRLWQDSDEEVEVRWFRAAPGARYLEVPTKFFSRHQWHNDKFAEPGEVGEVAYVAYDKGANSVGYTGQKRCGNDTAVSEGGVHGVDQPITTNAVGNATCCQIAEPICGGAPFPGPVVTARFAQVPDKCVCLDAITTHLTYVPNDPAWPGWFLWRSPVVPTPPCHSFNVAGRPRAFDLTLVVPKQGFPVCPRPKLWLRVLMGDGGSGWVQDGFSGFGELVDVSYDPFVLRDYWGTGPAPFQGVQKPLFWSVELPGGSCFFNPNANTDYLSITLTIG